MIFTGLSTASPSRRLEAFFQIDVEHQRRIGTAVVLCSMVEREVELLCWALSNEPFEATVKSTDRAQTSELLKRLAKAGATLEPRDLADLLSITAETAASLFEVRHTIVHGRPMPGAQGGAALIRNPSWIGEARSRPTTAITITDDNLDLVAEIALSVSQVVAGLSMVLVGTMPPAFALERAPEMRRRRDQAATILATGSSPPLT